MPDAQTLPSPLERLFPGAPLLSLERGQSLFVAGGPAQALYWLEWGELRTLLHGGAGREITLERFQATGWVLDPAVLDGGIHSFSCEARQSSGVRRLDWTTLERLPDPALTALLLRHLAEQHLRQTRQLERLLFWDVGARLAAYLLECALEGGQMLPTNSELASSLGTVPELVSRKLGEFYRAGLIRLEKRRLWVVQPEVLRRVVQGRVEP